ncbi:hypothetical protein PG995_007775 [Apiospora arundinis]
MRASFVSALVFTGLVGSAIANPVEASTKLEKPVEPSPVGYDDSFDDYADYSYQGSILKQALSQISGHIQIVNNYLETMKEPLSPGDKLALVGQIVPPLTFRTGGARGKGYGRGPKGGDKCNKLCIFDLVGKIVLQCHGVIFSTVSKCGLGFAFQYMVPLILTLIKSMTSLDRIVPGCLALAQGMLNQILGKCGFAGLAGFLGGL